MFKPSGEWDTRIIAHELEKKQQVRALAVDRQGLLFWCIEPPERGYADPRTVQHGCVRVCKSDGTFVTSFSGDKHGFEIPLAICVHIDGRILVADYAGVHFFGFPAA